MTFAAERSGRKWTLVALSDTYPHRQSVQSFDTKRAAVAAAVICNAGTVDPHRALVEQILADSAASWRRRGHSEADAIRGAVQLWIMLCQSVGIAPPSWWREVVDAQLAAIAAATK